MRSVIGTFASGDGGAYRSLWLSSEEPLRLHPELSETVRCDVCIVGGGFTGLWTAIEVKRAEPSAHVVLVEGDHCGSGASGRNGGFVMSWWSKFASLSKLVGVDEALRLAEASAAVMEEISNFCSVHKIDAAIQRRGWLWVASNKAQHDIWADLLQELAAHGHEPFEPLTREQARERAGSSLIEGAVFEATCAVVQPAKLALGLRDTAARYGVAMYERSPVVGIRNRRPLRVCTDAGCVEADAVVVAAGAWTGTIVPELRRSILVMASDIVATESSAQELDEIGLRRGLAVCDARLMVNYFHRTNDDRLVFGMGGGRGAIAFGSRVPRRFHGRSPRSRAVEASMRRFYPALQAGIQDTWTGPVDRSYSGLPFVLKTAPGLFVAAGFSGNGVGPSRIVAKTLSSLVLDRHDEWAQSSLINLAPKGYVPEPARFFGGLLVRRAVAAKERAEDEERRSTPLTNALVRLAPAGLATGSTPRSDFDQQDTHGGD